MDPFAAPASTGPTELPTVGGVPGLPEVTAAGSVVPIIGGTLLVTRDGTRAVAVDPDRDRVFVIDLSEEQLISDIALELGDVAARAVEGVDGHVFVAARGSGDVVGLDLEAGAASSRTYACDAPRGLAVDETTDELVVACQSGELVRLSSDGTTVESTTVLEPDLRDVVSSGTRLLVSRFRSAEVLEVTGDRVTGRLGPEGVSGSDRSPPYVPRVARRMQRLSDGTVFLQHQRANSGMLPAQTPYYAGNDCFFGVTHNTVSVLPGGTSAFSSTLGTLDGGFSADFAVSPDGRHFASLSYQVGQSQVRLGQLPEGGSDPCGRPASNVLVLPGEATAVAFDGEGRVIVQSREPAALHIIGASTLILSEDSRADMGHALFHAPTSFGVACASCHPEGGDDGMTWDFEEHGLRRTMSIGGGLLETAPFHWEGDRADMDELLLDTFVSRMGGLAPTKVQAAALGDFLDAIPAPAPLAGLDDAAIDRGAALFVRFGCDGCHAGAHYTNDETHDVGTGGAFQVPSLVGIGNRAPYMHDGCAPTLRDRFSECGGDKHGDYADATDADIDDLVAFLGSL